MEKLWKLQRNIERFYSLHSFFSEAREEKKETNRFHQARHGSGGIGSMISSISFSESVRELSKEFEHLMKEIVEFNKENT